VNQLASYYSEPTVRYWNAVVRILRYLKGTIKYKLRLGHQASVPNSAAIMAAIDEINDVGWFERTRLKSYDL
jgi:hypothetical protein